MERPILAAGRVKFHFHIIREIEAEGGRVLVGGDVSGKVLRRDEFIKDIDS